MLDIGKVRGDAFDEIARLLGDKGFTAKQYAKLTNTRTAPTDPRKRLPPNAMQVEALSD